MDFGVLGPLEVRVDGRPLSIGGPKQRALLAMLLLHPNEPVSRDRLIDGLWGECPPATAAHTLDSYVSRLRKLLGDDRLTRQPPGYRLRVEPGELDLERFDELAAEGRHRDALALWRGVALADLLYEPFAGPEVGRLEERRLSVLEDRIDADLVVGGRPELVPELEGLVREQPYRERLVGQLMLALYRSGQQARALEVYRSTKRRLAEELGLDPGPRLQQLERAILAHDPGLGASRPRSNAPRRKRGLVALVAAAVAAGAAVGIVLGTQGTNASRLRLRPGANQLLALGLRSASPNRAVLLGDAPAAIAAGENSLWLADPAAGAVSHLNPDRGMLVDRIPVGGTPGAVAVGGGSVWAASILADHVVRIDPATGTVTQTIGLGGAQLSALAFGAGGLWIADLTDNSLIELDPASGAVKRTLTLPLSPTALAIGDGAIWVADYEQDTVSEIDPASGTVLSTVRVGTGPSALAVGANGVWVANELDSTVSRIDPTTASVVATTPVGSGPAALAIANRSVWVADQYAASVSRIDPSRNAVTRIVPVGGSPTALALASGRLWVSVRSRAQHRGGTLVLLNQQPLKIDPARQFNLLPLVSDALTRDSLVTYAHTPGPTGIRIVPDLAIAVPLATDGGTAYGFRLRPQIRYSDGRAVRPSDIRRAIERLFRLGTPWRFNFAGLVGAAACTTKRCDLSKGIVTDDAVRTVTFRLRAPDPNFLADLTTTAASPVPPGTPWHDVGLTPIPGTGPYRIDSAGTREVRWTRNPYFREWSHAAQPDGNPDQIVLRSGIRPEKEIREIEAGRADWTADFIPPALLRELRTRFTSQLHAYAIPTTDFFLLNTHLRPFDDVRVRRALNFAVDRAELVRLYGGSDFAAPTCQVLPPGVAGYRRYCAYTRDPDSAGTWNGPDLARAQRLVAASGTRGTRITVWGWTDDATISPPVVRYVAGALRRLGYRTNVRLVPHSFFDHRSPAIFRSIQLIPYAWGDTSYGYFANWFACNAPQNHLSFCDRRIERTNTRARSLAGTDPRTAASLWTALDRKLVDRAVLVPMINEGGLWFVSARVRNYQSHPYWGLIADQLWVR